MIGVRLGRGWSGFALGRAGPEGLASATLARSQLGGASLQVMCVRGAAFLGAGRHRPVDEGYRYVSKSFEGIRRVFLACLNVCRQCW